MLQTLHDDVNDLIGLTLLIAGRLLWVRRHTLRCRWEVHGTAALLLGPVGTVLAMPSAEPYLGRALHAVFGVWQLDTLLGFVCWIGACAAALLHTATRLGDEDFAQKVADRFVKPLGLVCLPTMAVAWFTSRHLAGPYPGDDFFALGDGPWITVIKVTLCTAASVLLIANIGGLLILRTDPRSRWPATAMIVAATVMLLDVLYVGVTGVSGAAERFERATGAAWYVGCAAGILYGVVTAACWRRKVRAMSRRIKAPSES